MGFNTYIQSDRGDTISLMSYGGDGKPLAGFLMGFFSCCDNKGVLQDDKLPTWFAALGQATNRPFFHFSTITEKATISREGDFDQFGEDDYEKYISLYGYPITVEQFISTIEHYRNAWTDINLLLDFAATMLNIFKEVAPEADDAWYHPEYTVADFEALERLLLELNRINVKKVRIVID